MMGWALLGRVVGHINRCETVLKGGICKDCIQTARIALLRGIGGHAIVSAVRMADTIFASDSCRSR